MALGNPSGIRNAQELLAREGVFFLKDIVALLELNPIKIKNRVLEIQQSGQNPWEVIGARKIWNHWLIRMKRFAPYYRAHLRPRIRRIPSDWDGNCLLEQKGLFYLTEICRVIPFSAHQIRYQAKKTANARQKLGVWKDQEAGCFVVDMEPFSKWIITLWKKDA